MTTMDKLPEPVAQGVDRYAISGDNLRFLVEHAQRAIVEKDAEIERLGAEIERLQSRLAKLEAVAEAVLSELSGNPSELRDQVASAIRDDGSVLGGTPWEILSDDRKAWWRGDADRAIAAVKNYLITKAALGEKADG